MVNHYAAPDTMFSRALKLLTGTLLHMALGEKVAEGLPMHPMNALIEQKKRDMKAMLAALSDAKDDSWDHHDPKQVAV